VPTEKEVEEVPVADPKGKKKGTMVDVESKKKASGRGPNWSSREDECLAAAWKTVSIDHFIDANQNS
jgi:hypothetical protein